ncbi:MAG TPA: helix-turn-helix domain-containing protein [Polyangiaceae bacterium]|jgi:hypothetical protein|nr:helix-turn-helix domain-containing protein [Polyangiaceae bacterium]
MDPVLTAAARALALFAPLEALRGVALRNDAEALALRGVAMAQLGEFLRARKLLARAARKFDEGSVARARCLAAEAEVALACRDLAAAGKGLETAARLLDAAGDTTNATFVRLLTVRRMILLGELAAAERALRSLPLSKDGRLTTLTALARAEIAVRSFRSADAGTALVRARAAARSTKIASLVAEVEHAALQLEAPVARLIAPEGERLLTLAGVEALLDSGDLVIDGCRRELRREKVVVSLATRPVLFALASVLGEAAPQVASRDSLIRAAFGGKHANESLRARLRVELGRLRRVLATLAAIDARGDGFVMTPRRAARIHVLLPPEPGEASALLGLLGGSESWSTSALAAALGWSQRTVQRALGELHEAGRVRAFGQGRARRWIAPPLAGFATTLLLVARDGPQ